MKSFINFVTYSFILSFHAFCNAQVGEVFIAKKFNPGTHIMNLVELQRSSDSGQSLSVTPFYNSHSAYSDEYYYSSLPVSRISAVQDFEIDFSDYDLYYGNTNNLASGDKLEFACRRPNGLTIYNYDTYYGTESRYTYNFPSYGIKGFRPVCGGDINRDGTADILLQKRAKLSAFVFIVTTNSSYYYDELEEDLQFYNKTISINPAPDSRFKALGLLDIDNTNGVDLLVQVRKSIGIYANTGDTNGVVFSNFTKLYDLQKGERFVGIFNINSDSAKEIILQKGASVSALSAPDYNTASLQVVVPTPSHKILGPR